MELSHDQEKALNELLRWFDNRSNVSYITLGGFAGTGKTTLISIFREKLFKNEEKKLKVAFCSYTGRAAQILKNKLKENKSMYKSDTVSTIHGLIYSPIENARGEIIGWRKKDTLECKLIIVDEASMIDEEIWADLLSYKIPILAVGDHGQLPPIRGNFNLMLEPKIRLEEIHRQAKDNPIIHVSALARNHGEVPPQNFGKNVVKYAKADSETQNVVEELLQNYTNDMIVLCGYNKTRTRLNAYIRNYLGFEEPRPQSGDRVICLRNNHDKGIYNGMLGSIVSIDTEGADKYEVEIKMDDSDINYYGFIYAQQFGSEQPINFTRDRRKANNLDLFDFGYALTVHKAQGSQAKSVLLFEERFSRMDDEMWRRWLYTGITRAQKELFLVG